MAEVLNVHAVTTGDSLLHFVKVYRLKQWVQGWLPDCFRTGAQRTCRTSVTGGEKRCIYINLKHSRPWVDKDEQPKSQPTADLHQLKVMVVFGDYKCLNPYELMALDTTLTANMHIQLLDRLADKNCREGSE